MLFIALRLWPPNLCEGVSDILKLYLKSGYNVLIYVRVYLIGYIYNTEWLWRPNLCEGVSDILNLYLKSGYNLLIHVKVYVIG